MVVSRSAQLALQVEHHQRQGVVDGAMSPVQADRIVSGDRRSPLSVRSLCSSEQPEADLEGETIGERQAPQLVGCGEVEDLLVLGIRWVGGGVVQRGVHGDPSRSCGVGGGGSAGADRREAAGGAQKVESPDVAAGDRRGRRESMIRGGISGWAR